MSYFIVASVLADSPHRESQCIIRPRSEDVVFDQSRADASRCGEVGHCPSFFRLGPVRVYRFATPSRSSLRRSVLLPIRIYPNLNLAADHDSFLPPAVDRYHQLLHPTLQLVESVLVTVGAKNPDATKQALDFVMHHRETLRILIVESQQLSLSQLKELPLVVGICTYVVPRVPRADLVSRTSVDHVLS